MGDDWNDDADTGAAETSVIATAELPEINLFGKWNCDEVNVSDMSLQVGFSTSYLYFRLNGSEIFFFGECVSEHVFIVCLGLYCRQGEVCQIPSP